MLETLVDTDVVTEAIECRKAAESIEEDSSAKRWAEADAYAELARRGWTERRIAEACEVSKTSVHYFLACSSAYPGHLGDQRPSFWNAYHEIKSGYVHVSHATGQPEWYTPPEYIAAAKKVLGDIDLDPASCDTAQQVVQAKDFFTVQNDGLTKPWAGRIWLNPPFGRKLVSEFVLKLCDHFQDGDVSAALLLTNNATESQWFQRAVHLATAICMPLGRVTFLNEKLDPFGAPLQGQTVLYFGQEPKKFVNEFRQFGFCSELSV